MKMLKKSLAALLVLLLALSPALMLSAEAEDMTEAMLVERMGEATYSYYNEIFDATGTVKAENGKLVIDAQGLGETRHYVVSAKEGSLKKLDDGSYSVTFVNDANPGDVSDVIFTLEADNVKELRVKLYGQEVSFTTELYTVTLAETANGTVTANLAKAVEGREISLTATPAEGCVLQSLEYDDGETHDITAEKSFKMPKANVTVTAVFAPSGAEDESWLGTVAEVGAFLDQGRLPYASSAKYNAVKNAMEDAPATADEAPARIAALLAALRAYVESNALGEGYAGSEDQTALLRSADMLEGWELPEGAEVTVESAEAYTDSQGSAEHSYLEAKTPDLSLSQTLTLPAGTYLFTAKLRGSEGLPVVLTAGEESAEAKVHNKDKGVFGLGWDDVTLCFTLPEDGEVTLSVKLGPGVEGSWGSVGDLRLTKLGDEQLPILYRVLLEAGEGGSLTASVTEAAEGTTVKLSPVAEEGFTLDSLSATGENGEKLSIDTSYSFTMPAGEVTAKASFAEQVSYKITKGENGIWARKSTTGLSFTVERSRRNELTGERFTGLVIDRKEVDSANYSITDPFTLTLTPEYLGTLNMGIHTIIFNFEDGSVTTRFTIRSAGATPRTADDSQVFLYAALCLASAAALTAAALTLKKRRA